MLSIPFRPSPSLSLPLFFTLTLLLSQSLPPPLCLSRLLSIYFAILLFTMTDESCAMQTIFSLIFFFLFVFLFASICRKICAHNTINTKSFCRRIRSNGEHLHYLNSFFLLFTKMEIDFDILTKRKMEKLNKDSRFFSSYLLHF